MKYLLYTFTFLMKLNQETNLTLFESLCVTMSQKVALYCILLDKDTSLPSILFCFPLFNFLQTLVIYGSLTAYRACISGMKSLIF